jgi:hypothetical protein
LIILIIWVGQDYKLWSCSLSSFPQLPVTSSLFGPNILLDTLFSNTLSLCSSLNIKDHVSTSYWITDKIIVLYNPFLYASDQEYGFKTYRGMDPKKCTHVPLQFLWLSCHSIRWLWNSCD